MPRYHNLITLDEFTIQQLRLFPHATGELSGLLRGIGLAAKRVNLEVNKAALADILGAEGSINIQGEVVQKLDVYANNVFINVLRSGINCAGIVSEENEEMVVFDDAKSNQSKYVLLMDPIDGSGNIDINISIGSIFSVYRRVSDLGKPAKLEDFLQPGIKQVAAGYVIYGSSTILVYATRRGVNGFTLDTAIGEFYLSHPNLKMPPHGLFYSFDNRYYNQVDQKLKNYVDFCISTTANKNGPYSNRYYGCMVADIHRNLLKGGIFFYPQVTGKPNGKLRLCYECNPMAFITEVAGGNATDGKQRILDIQPEHIHQRSPLFIGSKEMMEDLQRFLPSAKVKF
ncbi:class 1 fructose-bisphosphatase [Agriterribacter humi]|uniref:class 1 fructose-bisphosphatase n=1 Tax=Agriterribacter humi TaxID=1104781 RepID=UPI0012640BC6|nr:class 1 fructose-bisphosphatase [Agriterribacter humi]